MKDEQLYQTAEDIFFELASENLSEEKMQCLQANASGFFIELQQAIGNDWSALVYNDIDEEDYEEYVEFWFFIEPKESGSENNTKIMLAKMLLSIDSDDKDCHIDWSPVS